MKRKTSYAPSQLLEYLDGLGIKHATTEHPPVYTVEEAKRLRGRLPGANCKSLFLKNKKHDMWLVVVMEDQIVDLGRLADAVGSKRLSFASPDRLMAYLGVTPGAVSPLAVINDRSCDVTVVIADTVMNHDQVNFHPLVNNQTTTMSSRDFVAFLESTGHDPVFLRSDVI